MVLEEHFDGLRVLLDRAENIKQALENEVVPLVHLQVFNNAL